MKEERFVIKVVEMYYKQGMSQVEIGKKLNVSRTTISRALDQARKEGYVQIQINYPEGSMTNIEAKLEQKYHLKEVVIACGKNDEDTSQEIAFYTSDYILRTLKNHMTLGLSSGVTLQKMVGYLEKDVRLKFLKADDVNVVPLIATMNAPVMTDKKKRLRYSNFAVEKVADIINGNGYQLMAPQYVSSAKAKQQFMKEESIQEVINLAKKADIVVMGIGTVTENSMVANTKLIPPEELKRLIKKGGTGEILSHVVDKQGNLIRDEYEQRLISLELEDLKKIPIRVGVAYGIQKIDAILSVLKGGWINVLITDEKVAAYLADIKE